MLNYSYTYMIQLVNINSLDINIIQTKIELFTAG